MADSKRKRFTYKVAKLLKSTGDPKTTLESLLRAAIKKVPTAVGRMEKPASSNVERRFLNYSLTHAGGDGNGQVFGCEFFAFEEGEGLSTIKMDATATEIPVDAIKAGKDQEFLAGSVYFGVSGKHVIICQSRGLKAKDLENYLNWFLVEKAKVLASDNRISLNDHIPKSKKALFKGVKGIEIKGPVQMVPSDAVAKQAAADEEAAKAAKAAKSGKKKKPADGEAVAEPPKKSVFYPVALAGKAWEAVKTLVGDSFQLPNEINVDNLADTPDIEVQIFLKWKGQHHEDDSDFLDGVASNLRHIDDELDYEVKSASGTLGRDDIKIYKELNVSWTNKGRPKFEDIFPKMAEWLAGLASDGKVDP